MTVWCDCSGDPGGSLWSTHHSIKIISFQDSEEERISLSIEHKGKHNTTSNGKEVH